MIQPHTMYMFGSMGISAALLLGFINHRMTIALSVADAQLKDDGENAYLIMYNGKRYEVPIKHIVF